MRSLHPILLALLLAAGPAVAQDAPAPSMAPAVTETPTPRLLNGTRFGSWTLACEAIAVGETNCVLSQRLVRSSDDTFLVEIIAFWSGDLAQRYLAARVPVGVYLPSGFVLGLADDAAQMKFDWQACGDRLCEALLETDPATITRIDAANEATVGYRPSAQADPVIFKIGTDGLSDGLDALYSALQGS